METSRRACGGCALQLICRKYFFQAIRRGSHPASLPLCPFPTERRQARTQRCFPTASGAARGDVAGWMEPIGFWWRAAGRKSLL